jgi:hypothetical protein
MVAIIATSAARIPFGRQMIAADDRFVASFGISPEIHFILKIVFVLLAFAIVQPIWTFRRTK